MCGRYTIVKSQETVSQTFQVNLVKGAYRIQYNACPSMMLPVITNENPSTLQFHRWGLIPAWAKSESIGNKLINARSETLSEKPSFKYSFQHQRCLVIADSYYEWMKKGAKSPKTPYRVTLEDNSLFAFAGIWAKWKNQDNALIYSFSIITTTPQPEIAHLHHRMPVILAPSQYALWIDNQTSQKDLAYLLQAYQGKLKYYTVSTRVNSVANNTPNLIEPYINPQGKLF